VGDAHAADGAATTAATPGADKARAVGLLTAVRHEGTTAQRSALLTLGTIHSPHRNLATCKSDEATREATRCRRRRSTLQVGVVTATTNRSCGSTYSVQPYEHVRVTTHVCNTIRTSGCPAIRASETVKVGVASASVRAAPSRLLVRLSSLLAGMSGLVETGLLKLPATFPSEKSAGAFAADDVARALKCVTVGDEAAKC
jgi:hypothetical protein